MQIITDVRQRVQQLIEDNATTLLTAGGVVGVVGTAALAWRGGYKYSEIVGEEYGKRVADFEADSGREAKPEDIAALNAAEKAKLMVPHILPPVITGTTTIAAVIMANRMSGQKAAALAAAYGLSQKQLEEYKNKVAEKLGVQKEQKIKDELAQDRVNNTPGSSQIIVVEGEVLCFDEPTGRYFRSTMEKINQAVNATNTEIIHHDAVSASYFYDELGLPSTTWTDEVGWNHNQLLELAFSTVMTDDGRPCIAIDFKTLPKLEYVPRHY